MENEKELFIIPALDDGMEHPDGRCCCCGYNLKLCDASLIDAHHTLVITKLNGLDRESGR